jgi:hypothetical protein
MNRYDSCSSCSRYVKRMDATCPFCGAHKATTKASRASVGRRMSRAEWLAVGSAMVLGGCSGQEVSTTLDGASSVTSVSLGFACGDAQCAPAGEYCLAFGPVYNLSYSCESYDSGGWAPGDATCGPHPTCGCSAWVGSNFDDGVCGCNDDGGVVNVTACHSCYGAPPARLERLGRVV